MICKVAAGRGEHIGKHTVSKIPFLLKNGVKMEVLTAEGPDKATVWAASPGKEAEREVELAGEGGGFSEVASSVTLKSKAELFLNREGKSHRTVLCNSELSSHVQLHS